MVDGLPRFSGLHSCSFLHERREGKRCARRCASQARVAAVVRRRNQGCVARRGRVKYTSSSASVQQRHACNGGMGN